MIGTALLLGWFFGAGIFAIGEPEYDGKTSDFVGYSLLWPLVVCVFLLRVIVFGLIGIAAIKGEFK